MPPTGFEPLAAPCPQFFDSTGTDEGCHSMGFGFCHAVGAAGRLSFGHQRTARRSDDVWGIV